MQKRPYIYSQVVLEGDFPFTASRLSEQGDKAITYLHFHNAPELGICIEGAGVFVVEGKILPFKDGDIVYIGREERHLAQSAAGSISKWHWIHFDLAMLLHPAFMNAELADLSMCKGPSFKNVISRDAHPRLCSMAVALLDAWMRKGAFQKERIIACLTLFAAEMRLSFQELPAPEKGKKRGVAPEPDTMHRLDKAIESIASGHKGVIDMAKLARACGLSPTHFRRLFRQTFGKSPRSYLNQMRIAMAMAQLESANKPVSEIALSCGFGTISSFNRQFKTQTSLSPRKWRKRKS